MIKTLNKKVIALVIGLIMCAPLVFASQTVSVRAAVPEPNPHVFGMNISFNGDPATSRGLSFFTSAELNKSADVLVSRNADLSDAEHFRSEVTVHNLTANASGVRRDYFIHRALLDGLTPGTRYYFKAGSIEFDLWGQLSSFRTDDIDSNRVTFLVTADVHFGGREGNFPENQYFNAVLTDAFRRNPDIDFVISNGDMYSQWGNGGYFFMQDERIDLFTSSTYLHNTTWVPVTGNHDQYPDNPTFFYAEYRNTFPGLNSGIAPTQGLNMSFEFGNTFFASVANLNRAAFTLEQYQWLDRALAETEMDFRIVLVHANVFNGLAVFTESRDMALMARHNVDVVFQGHSHNYVRTRAMLGGGTVSPNEAIREAPNRNFYLERPGVIYVTNSTTGGGDIWTNVAPTPNRSVQFGNGATLPGIGTIGSGSGMYTLVTIEDGNLTAEVYVRAGANALSPFVLFETWGIRKYYYREFARHIAALPELDTLTFGNAEQLALYQDMQERFGEYEESFPQLAQRLDPEMRFKLNTGLRILTESGFSMADRSEIIAQLAEARALNRRTYSSETWAGLDAAIRAASAVHVNLNSTPAQITGALAALAQARAALAPLDRTALAAAIAEAREAPDASVHTVESVALVGGKRAEARHVMNSLSQTEINATAAGLQAAIDALAPPDTAELSAAIALIGTLVRTDYTPVSWTSMIMARDRATAVLTSFSQMEIDNMAAELQAEMSGLVRLNRAGLISAIAAAEALVQAEYTPESWADLTAALAFARARLTATSQREIDDGVLILTAATAMLQRVSDTGNGYEPNGCGSASVGGAMAAGMALFAVFALAVLAKRR